MKPFVMYGVASSIAMIVAFGSFIMGLARIQRPKSRMRAILLIVFSIPFFYGALKLSQESDWLKGVKTTTAQNFIRMAQNYSNEFPVSGTDYPGDMSPAGKCGRAVVLVQGANGKFTSSNYFDHDLPRDYRAKSVQELQTLILVKAVSQIVKLPSQTDQTGMRTHRYFYIIDKKR